MAKQWNLNLSKRERQIMDVIYRLGEATAAEVRHEIPKPPTYSAVRAALRVLEEKGHLKHEYQGPRYVFKPTVKRERARRAVLHDVMRNFFDGSVEEVVIALLDISRSDLSDEERDRLLELIHKAQREGR